MDILVTKRLTLRSPLEVDAEAICAAMQNTNVSRMLTPVPHPYSIKDARKWIDVTSKDENASHFSIYRQKLLGVVSVGVDADGEFNLGYWLNEWAWGNGYMAEAARAALSHSFKKSGTDKIYSGSYADNHASRAILAKLGFEDSGTKTNFNPTRQCHVTCNRVVLTRQKFESLFGALDVGMAA